MFKPHEKKCDLCQTKRFEKTSKALMYPQCRHILGSSTRKSRAIDFNSKEYKMQMKTV